LLTRKGGVCRR